MCKILKAICSYDAAPLVLTTANVDRVAAVYFTHHLLDEPPESPRSAPPTVRAPVPTVVPPPVRVPLAT